MSIDVRVIQEVSLSETERRAVSELLDEITSHAELHEENCFLDNAPLISHDLPRSIRQQFHNFKRFESSIALKISNNPVSASDIGPTPLTPPELEPDFKLNRLHMLHGLYASLLGEVVSFKSQRNGRLFTNLIPLKDQADVHNYSGGSTYKFDLHTEDCFHPCMSDYLGLTCMKNLERAATSIAPLRSVKLDDEAKDILFQPRFKIGANAIHGVDGPGRFGLMPILFGSREDPFMKINVCNINLNDYSGDVQRAISILVEGLQAASVSTVLNGGDCLYVDNLRCAHSRDAYKPLYGENARWLSRVIVADDLRKSVQYKENSKSRCII
ncbi:MAG: TauD/TfdA family dioxygenase [Rhodospirillaceae bacterium]|nr:TauD/TfdA family dioxygenase [Rhodospirillales bacterium]